ncbi:MAG: PilZ domain-containing protein [Thermodesulfobacteriota bacterium]|nr:PilZ domain-containing protein [Thermodesulfobacteriota bacterium]
MKNGIEKRRDPRISADWPVVLMTPQGAIKGKTANISISGLGLLLFSETPEIDDEFQITLKPSEGREMSMTCEKIWSGSINLDGSVYSGIGVRFTKISSIDREIIASLVAEYYLI